MQQKSNKHSKNKSNPATTTKGSRRGNKRPRHGDGKGHIVEKGKLRK